nr:hypothetical protein [Mycobacterium gordonae]
MIPAEVAAWEFETKYDVASIWGAEAIERADEKTCDNRGSYLIPGAGH